MRFGFVGLDPNMEDDLRFQALLAARGWSAQMGIAFMFRWWRTLHRQNSTSGEITDWSEAFLARTTRVKGAGLLDALIEVGLVERDDGGRLFAANWRALNGDAISRGKRPKTPEQQSAAGRARAESAERDALGRMLPDGRAGVPDPLGRENTRAANGCAARSAPAVDPAIAPSPPYRTGPDLTDPRSPSESHSNPVAVDRSAREPNGNGERAAEAGRRRIADAEELVREIVRELRDPQSEAFHRMIVAHVPRETIRRVLAETREEHRLGKVKSPAPYFTRAILNEAERLSIHLPGRGAPAAAERPEPTITPEQGERLLDELTRRALPQPMGRRDTSPEPDRATAAHDELAERSAALLSLLRSPKMHAKARGRASLTFEVIRGGAREAQPERRAGGAR